MTKTSLIEKISAKLPHLSTHEVEIIVSTLFAAITSSLRRGERVDVRGFGTFSIREREGHIGRNPKTGEPVTVPPKRVPFFTVGNELRERVAAGARRGG